MKVRIKAGWSDEGQTGVMLGDKHFQVNQYWTPVLWDDEEDPDFHKTIALEFWNEDTETWDEIVYRETL